MGGDKNTEDDDVHTIKRSALDNNTTGASEYDIDNMTEEDKLSISTVNDRETFNERVDYLIGKLDVGKTTGQNMEQKFRREAFVLYIRVKQWLKILNTDQKLLRQNQRMLSLKYHGLKRKIDFVQISVIAVASCMTFIDSVKQYIDAPSVLNTVLPIIMSTYIGFIIAIARFYKWDDSKETLTKMNEKLALVINQLWQKIKFGNLHKDIYPSIQWEEYFTEVHQKLDDFDKDGLIDAIVHLKQEIDVILNYSEKLVYKDMLSSLNLQDAFIDKKIKTVDSFKQEILLDNRRISNYNKFRVARSPIQTLSHILGANRVSTVEFFKRNMFENKKKVSTTHV